ncbi:unnamed protein product [Sphagnum tenellum]
MAETTISAQEHASLQHVLAELALKEQVCKDLEKCQMTLWDQVQQLQLENKACKSGLKRENQWQLEREKLIFDLDSANLAAVEKDERIQQLERDLSGARGAVDCVQTKCKEIERSKDKEINQKERLQAELEDARIAIEELERDCKLKEEMLTKQRQAESDLFRKLEIQKKLLQSHLSEAKRKAEEFDEMEMNFQIATQKLNDKDKQLNYLRDAHEKLCIANTGRQMQGRQEKETVINALEASQEKLSVAELAETKKQAEELVLKLKATENSLKQEIAARDLAELALKEYKKREEHLLMIEEGHSELQGKSKWRNEQFQSLEEAHSIIRTEFQESQRIWESERDSMVGEIDTLRENLQSKGKLIHDLHCRLDMLQQALAHEQSHRKVLELELVEARTGMGEAAADLERMHSVIENLKRETGEEIVLLKNNVLVKDRQIREMEIRQKEIQQEHEELQSMQLEFENFKRLNGELQQALGLKDKQILLLEEARNNDVGVAQARGLEWEEEKNLLIQSLTEAEASLSSKEATLKELSNELDAVRSSLECLRAAKLDFEQKNSEEKDNLLLILHQANETLAREIAKAKSSLAQKEREEAFLQDRLTDLERHLQDKEREMIEMEVYLDSVVKASEAKQADIDKLTLKMQDMKKGADEWKKREIDLETELHGLKITLEEKSVSLLESEAEVKRASEEHQVMKGEIKDLKQQLSEEVKVNSVQQCKMDELICDLESAKQAVELANVQLKELQGKLQQLDQGSKDRLQRSEIASDELQNKLMSTESRLHTSGKKMEEAAVDLAAYEEKYACLLLVISEKDKLFDEVQGKLSSAQLELAEQAMWKEQAVAVAEQTKCLKLELDNAMNVIADLTAQLELQEEKELTMEKKTQQLEGDLARAEEEALSRRLKMLHILAQLESTHASQKELKAQLEMQHRQLTNEADGFSVDYSDGEGPKKEVWDDLMRRIVKDQLREWEKARGKEVRQEEEERACAKKQRVENGALLSLALPDTSLSLSSGDPHGHQSFLYQVAAQSYHPSQAQTHTHSSGFTNLISLSHSQPFHHNPSCSLTQSSLDKMEMSSGSQQISQVKEQESRGSWQMSYGSNHANEGFLALPVQGKQRPKPLCQRLFQSGNDHHSLGSECLWNQGRERGESDIVDIGQGSHQVAPTDFELQATHSSDARQQQKHRHNDEVRSSLSHGESSRDTQPRNLPSHVERIPSREKRLLERGAIGPETFTSIQVQDVVSESIPLIACRLQELPDSFLEGLKGSLRNMLNCIEKREQFVLLQQTLAARTDLITDTLLRAHRVQLELLVAVKTGIPAFLHPEIPMTHSALVEVFLQTKCRNFACQSQLPADECDCRLCAQKTGFCNSCMCVVCSKFDFDANTCRWIGCDFCLHWCHTDCGIRMGYIAPGPSICGAAGTSEMQFHCIACDHTSELYGFVKDVFCNCARQWSQDVLASELDCVRRIFHDSNDARGQQLCSKAEQMLQQLGAQVDLPLVCSTVLKFFSGEIQSQAPSVSNEVQSQPPPVSNGVVKNPPASQKRHEVSTRDALEQARTALQTYDAELEEKRKEAAELQQELEREKGQIEELERIIRIKQAEAKMFAVRADEAQREAEGLQRIVLAKAEKIEQEYASNMAKLHLEEAEDHCHKAHNTLQVLQQAQLGFHTLQLPLLSELCDLLKQLDATRLQSSK